MREYLEFWRHYADFKGKTTRRGFWAAIVTWGAVAFVLLMILSIIAMFALNLTPEEAVSVGRTVLVIYGGTSIVPLLAITLRRLRDAGYSAKSVLWLLVPVIGQIAFFARLCSKTKK